ncbi:heme biosynthesis HemY N-terminal domain-containing protein [Endozoicomonas sp. 4G]|uniref:heme biosynthesis HemY N-terminal domain-containing protein n=1 Tax=Endozoicomonas sp. 4G TaxID=2872754 RepID=UPI002078FC9D|nr:heme biosynthesis HemY N-terminal domain-containing protein [Endozoicomonas sp. 4G]
MKSFILFLVILGVTFGLANAMINDSGYVLISYNTATFESTLWGLFLLIGLAIAALWLVWIILKLIFGVTGFIYPMTSGAKAIQARKMTTRGFVELTQGHWKKAERLLSQAADYGTSPLLNYLAAARAAHENGNLEAAAEYLRRADHKEPGAELAIGITQAQLQLSSGQLEQALATLTKLHKQVPRHAYVLKMLKQVYSRLNDWQSLAALLPKLKKHKVVSDEEHRSLELQCFEALFNQAFNNGRSFTSVDQRTKPATQIWNSLSAGQKRHSAMIYRYAKCLTDLGAEEKAEALLRDNLNKHYSSEIALLYGKIKGKDLGKQLHFAETLLNERPNDADLLLTLGRLSLRNELWGKAREYFEASLRLSKRVDTYNELGRLLAHMDDHQSSSLFFQEGLRLAAGSVVDVLPAKVMDKK